MAKKKSKKVTKKKISVSKKSKSAKRKSIFSFDGPQVIYSLATAVGIFAILLLIFFGSGLFKKKNVVVVDKNVETEVIVEQEDDCDFRAALNGICVADEDAVHVPLVAVMVENHVDAQPLSGIADASVVYEAPVEGSIPRLLAVYPVTREASQVGPIRSARPYYLDWLSEYSDAMYMHVGGSPEALEGISSEGVFDINEMTRGWYFWRSDNRFAPHNTYTSSKLWQDAAQKYAPQDVSFEIDAWKFGKLELCEEECVEEIELSYGGGVYYPSWKFDKESEQYTRSEFGRTDRDQGGEAIVADTVVVQHVDAQVIDDVGRLSIDTIGQGDAVVFVGGYAIEGTWKKDSRKGRTNFFDSNDDKIVLAPGKIWVQVVSQFNRVTY